jgi:hypothetical protein
MTCEIRNLAQQPDQIDRQQQEMQSEDRDDAGAIAISDERDIADQRNESERSHCFHAEGQQDTTGRKESQDIIELEHLHLASPLQ